nr:immunoglobulin heavy chain junction region [Macaca mulatta]
CAVDHYGSGFDVW